MAVLTALTTGTSPARTSLAPSGHALSVAGPLLLGLTVLGVGAEELVGPHPAPKEPASSATPAAPTTARRRYQGPRALVRAFLAAADVEGTTPMVAAF